MTTLAPISDYPGIAPVEVAPAVPSTRTTVIAPTVHGILAYKLSVAFHLAEPEDISYTVLGPDSTGLQAGQIPPTGYLGVHGALECSFDGTGIDARILSTGAELAYDQPGYVTETGKSIAYALQTSAIVHRFTAQHIALGDAFTAAAGTILTNAGNTILGASGDLPDQGGIGNYPAGPFTFTFTVDSTIAAQTLDVDINEDNVLHATQVIMERAGSYVDPQRTMYVLDSGDKGYSSGPNVMIGAKGGSDHLTFDLDGAAGNAPVLRGSSVQAQTTDMCASCSFKGGDAHHGMPASGRITDLVAHRNGMALLGVYASTGVGGVYFFPGDGAVYPMTQAMGVNAIAYDLGNTRIYAATDAGVYYGPDDTLSTVKWTRLGKMSLKCPKIQLEGATVFVLAEMAGTSEHHVLKSTPGTTDLLGYPDWSQIVSKADLVDFAVMGDYVYGVVRTSPGTLFYQQLSTGASDVLALPGGTAAITGLDYLALGGAPHDGVFVRTSLGSQDLYRIGSATPTTLTAINTDNSLVDGYGAPVMVNSIRFNSAGALQCTTGGVNSLLLASTSLGVYSCINDDGSTAWIRTDGQSNIGDFTALFAAAGPPTSIAGGTRTVQPVYAVADTTLYFSNNGSVNWHDAFSAPLDAGPYFYHYYRTGGDGTGNHWPTWSDISFTVTYNSIGYTLQRILTHIGSWAYVLTNPASSAPAGQHRTAEISEISSPALMSDITASGILVDAMARFLALTAQPQITLQVLSRFDVTDTANPLRTLRPCMQVAVIGTPNEYLIAPGLDVFSLGLFAGTYYVLDHQLAYDRDQDPSSIVTTTKLGALLLNERQDILHVTADLQYQTSRQQLYRSRARR